MKKLFLILPLIALVGCNNSYESMFANCEKIETTKEHLVYKCPASQEWVQKVKQLKPTGKFKTGGKLNLDELYADKAHVYAEVVFDDKNFCKENFTIRTMVANPNEDKWAFIGCR